MARLYSNENFPQPVVERLRELGHDVLGVVETGGGGLAISDAEVLQCATADNRAVLTLNRKHFIQLHSLTPAHAGIIVCTFDADFSRQPERVHATIERTGDLPGQLLRVNRPQVQDR